MSITWIPACMYIKFNQVYQVYGWRFMQTSWKSSFHVLIYICYFLNTATHYKGCGETKNGCESNSNPCPFEIGEKLLQIGYTLMQFTWIRKKDEICLFWHLKSSVKILPLILINFSTNLKWQKCNDLLL